MSARAARSRLDTVRQRLHEVWMLLTDTFYRTKYRAVSHQLGLAERDEALDRGFVAIQIDSLAHDHLRVAMERGYAPYMRRMLERGHLLLPYTSGLPSSTPACQSAIMYGTSHDIPGFRWYDKRAGRVVSYKLPFNNADLEREVAARGGPGILEGGSSYANLLSGGASRSLFTMSTFGRGSLLDGIKGLGFFALFLLSPVRSLRVLAHSVTEALYAVAERAASYWTEERRVRFEGVFPLTRVLAHVFVKEMQTFAVMIDMYRGIPNIYTTYNTYDNLAHHYGPLTRPALRAVRTVDRQVRQIDRMRRHGARRYDLWVLSDHGQTPAAPFRQLYGQTFGRYVARLLDDRSLAEHVEAEPEGRSHVAFLLDELESAERSLGRTGSRAVGRFRRYVERKDGREGSPAGTTPPSAPHAPRERAAEPRVIVTGCSATAGIYFNELPGRADLSTIEAAHPGVIDALVEHPSTGLLIGREGRRVVALGRRGRLIWDGEQARVVGANPLDELERAPWTLREIVRVAHYPRSADLLVFGAVNGEIGVAYEEQVGVHGAFGGPQAHPFLLAPQARAPEPGAIRSAHDIYPIFRAYLDGPTHAARDAMKVDRRPLNLVG